VAQDTDALNVPFLCVRPDRRRARRPPGFAD
jgi:hypothetical protein